MLKLPIPRFLPDVNMCLPSAILDLSLARLRFSGYAWIHSVAGDGVVLARAQDRLKL
jgi:hypothetical protein